jgi:asparagine synthase (glutamine-hydrolysing)
MCRFAGIVDIKCPPTEGVISAMRDSMYHGGPDDQGIYIDKEFPLAFGFRRLSILDLSLQGHQPMLDEEERIVLMFNGEIYNFRELKAELQTRGYRFQSTSDTEVILKSYLEWGKSCFEKFNGMFAIALLDKRTNVLLLARDHAGIKPLYFSLTDRSLHFASEVRAFKTVQPDWPENSDWRKAFLIFGHMPEPYTTLKNVESLAKGSLIEVRLDSFQVNKHSFFNFDYKYSIYDKVEAVAKVKHAMEKAVERHLISDAPIGMFLSGGLDSSLITLLAKRSILTQLQTLSIVFEDEKFSEKYYQDIVIEKTKAHHRSFLVKEQDFKNSLPDIIQAMDQPSHDGINMYFISKYAKQLGLKVALSGLGADELFGGYPSFNRTRIMQIGKWFPGLALEIAGKLPGERLKKVQYLGMKSDLGFYLFNRGFFLPKQVAELLGCTENEVNQVINKFEKTLPVIIKEFIPLEKVSYLETNLYMQNQLLRDTDYMSMWHSIEVRVPFIDKELMQLVYHIDPAIRYGPTQLKSLMIQAFQDILPREIVRRKKQGFSFPFANWMQKDLSITSNSIVSKKLQRNLRKGSIHWSKYWSYILSQQ